MTMRPTARAVWVAALLAVPTAQAADRLTLDDAIARVASTHPELRLFEARGAVLDAGRNAAAQRPALAAGLQVENVLGTDDHAGLKAAEISLTLASVLERGGKLDARRTLAQSRIDGLAVERETRRLDLLAEVARRYLTMIAARHQQDIAATDIAQRQRTLAAARARLAAGASPESVVLTAAANLARTELAQARASQQWNHARQQLAALWGEREPDFEIESADPLVLPAIADRAALARLLDGTPELGRFADEHRIREARLQLARSDAVTDIQWQVGVRMLSPSDDAALIAGFSLPLGSKRRAEPAIRAASAELAQLAIEREAAELSLYSTLGEAHGRYGLAQLELARLRDEVLPMLLRADAAAEQAYLAGAISYMEWAQVQSELTATRRQQLEVAVDAQRALIEIQRLTGQPFVAGHATVQGTTP
jgi:cobalt-zinc-cadmium efflux system outer membrane protein